MGVYLSTPNTELEGTQDGRSGRLVFGAASMQGWRVGQEDAHIAIADYDNDTSLFGVFDGHGGPEVSKYCAQHLPNFIKSLNSYKNNNLMDCLEEAFLKLDKKLIEKEVIEELKLLAGHPDIENEANSSDDEINEAILLREEADLPISEIYKRYGIDSEPESDHECGSSSNKPGLSIPNHLRSEAFGKDRVKPCSPYLRAKRGSDSNHQPKSTEEVDPSKLESSSSSTSLTTNPTPDMTEVTPKTTSESENNLESTEVLMESSLDSKELTETEKPNVLNGNSESNKDVTNDVSNSVEAVPPKSDNENGSTDPVNNEPIKTDSEQNSETKPYKGKGKYKKVIPPKRVRPDSANDDSEKPIYEYFMEDFDEEDEESDDSEEFEGPDDSSDEEPGDVSEDDSESEDEKNDEDNKSAPSFEKPGYDSGCTAVVALLRDNHLFVANAGDSRCVVARDGKAIDMSIDHKPEDDIERERISRAGGKVTRDGRVNGGLNLSRAIGDHAYKQNDLVSDRDQMITALPDIKSLELDPKTDSFMVIACDGIWNSLTSQQVVDFVAERIDKVNKLSVICDDLFRACLAPNTHGDGTGCDNMTAVIVRFIFDKNLKRKLDETEDTSALKEANILNDESKPIDEESQTKKQKTSEEEVEVKEEVAQEVKPMVV